MDHLEYSIMYLKSKYYNLTNRLLFANILIIFLIYLHATNNKIIRNSKGMITVTNVISVIIQNVFRLKNITTHMSYILQRYNRYMCLSYHLT